METDARNEESESRNNRHLQHNWYVGVWCMETDARNEESESRNNRH